MTVLLLRHIADSDLRFINYTLTVIELRAQVQARVAEALIDVIISPNAR